MFRFITLVLVSVLIISACTSQRFSHIGPDRYINYGASADFYTVYLGSDTQYHYFAWSDGISSGRWKIHKDELTVLGEHEVKNSADFAGSIKDGVLTTERYLRNNDSKANK